MKNMHTPQAGEGGDAGGGGGGAPPPPAPATPAPGTPPAGDPPKPSGEPKPGTPTPSEPPKPGDPKPPSGTEKAPDEKKEAAAYDVRRPESIKQDDPLWVGFTAKAKEAGLPPEHATVIGEWFAQKTAELEKAAAAQWQETKQGWQKALAEKHGTKLEEMNKEAQAGVLAAGGPDLVKLISDYGLDDHPVLHAHFLKFREMTREDSSLVPRANPSPTKSREERLSKFYDHPSSRPSTR